MSTKWAFALIGLKLASQHKWEQAPVFNQWAEVVRQVPKEERYSDARSGRTVYDDFMFNPAKFSSEEVTYEKHCALP